MQLELKHSKQIIFFVSYLPSNGVRLMEFEFIANFSRCRNAIFVNTCSIERLTLHAHHECENVAEFAWWKIFYFIFRKPIKLTSAVGVRLMGQYKHTNINLTTDVGSD